MKVKPDKLKTVQNPVIEISSYDENVIILCENPTKLIWMDHKNILHNEDLCFVRVHI